MSKTQGETNELSRQKYFVDANTVLSQKQQRREEKKRFSPVIDSSKVKVGERSVVLKPGGSKPAQKITVNVLRDGGKIKTIKIMCPCGRHAELNCEYDS